MLRTRKCTKLAWPPLGAVSAAIAYLFGFRRRVSASRPTRAPVLASPPQESATAAALLAFRPARPVRRRREPGQNPRTSACSPPQLFPETKVPFPPPVRIEAVFLFRSPDVRQEQNENY